jgi:hypothetical protein
MLRRLRSTGSYCRQLIIRQHQRSMTKHAPFAGMSIFVPTGRPVCSFSSDLSAINQRYKPVVQTISRQIRRFYSLDRTRSVQERSAEIVIVTDTPSPNPLIRIGSQVRKRPILSVLNEQIFVALNSQENLQPENEGFTAESPFREIEPGKDLNNGAMYKLMTWGITPRPVAFVSTMSNDGQMNVSWSFLHV